MNLFYAMVKALIYIPVRIVFPTKLINKDRLPKERRVIMISNHLSWIDIVILSVYTPKFRHYIAKKEIGKNPIIRLLAKMLGVILIDRTKPDLSAIRKIIKMLKKNHMLSLFPEGTRNRNDTSLQEVRGGVSMFSLKGDAQIFPVMIYRKSKPFRKNYIYADYTFSLTEQKNRPVNSKVLAEATEIVTQKMTSAMNDMNNYVSELLAKKEMKKNKISNTVNTAIKDNTAKEVTAAETAEISVNVEEKSEE